MRRGNILSSITILVGAVLWTSAAANAFGKIADLTTAGSSDEIGGAVFVQTDPQPTGTGVIDPFVRIRQNGQEAAYNTSGTLPGIFDQLSGAWNSDLKLSGIPIVEGNYQFLLDINQSGSELLSLNQLQVFLTDTPGQIGGSRDDNGYLTGLTDVVSVYDLNPGGGAINGITLNYALNSGSGSGDMFLYLPTSMFAGKPGEYVILYSHFGHPPGNYGSNDGYEEWATVAAIPEPTAMLLGGLLLVAARMMCKSRAA